MKEYNDRWEKELVNKGFTIEEYEKAKERQKFEEFLKEREEKDQLFGQ